MITATTSLDDVLQLIQGWDPSNLRQRRVDLFVDPIPSPHGHFFLHGVSSLGVHLQLMASSSQCRRLRRGRHLR